MSVFINLVVIRVSDMERAKEFYATVGLVFSLEQHGNGPKHLAAESGETVFEIYPRGNGQPSAGTRLGFRVSSVEATVSALRRVGAEIVSGPTEGPWGVRAVVVDSE